MGELDFRNLFERVTTKWRKVEENLVDGVRDILIDIGCWRSQETQEQGLLHFRFWLPRFSLCICIFLSLVASPISIYQFRDEDVIKIMEPTAAMFITWMLVVYIASFSYRIDKFNKMMTSFNEMMHFDSPTAKRSENINDQLKWLSKLSSRFFTFSIAVSLPSFILGYTIYAIQKRELAFRYWFPDDLKPVPYFEIFLTMQILNLLFGSSVYFLTNAFIVALLTKTIGQLRILNHNLKQCAHTKYSDIDERDSVEKLNLSSRNNNVLMPSVNIRMNQDININLESKKRCHDKIGSSTAKNLNVQSKALRCVKNESEDLIRSIRHHQAIIRFKRTFDIAFSPILLLYYANSVIPCILGVLAIIYTSEFDSRTLIFAGLVIIQLINLGLFCWLGEQINEQNERLSDAVFGCDWLRASDSFKRSMRIIMSRSNQPMVIKVAGFVPLNLQTFSQVLQLVYSYYTSLSATLEIKTD